MIQKLSMDKCSVRLNLLKSLINRLKRYKKIRLLRNPKHHKLFSNSGRKFSFSLLPRKSILWKLSNCKVGYKPWSKHSKSTKNYLRSTNYVRVQISNFQQSKKNSNIIRTKLPSYLVLKKWISIRKGSICCSNRLDSYEKPIRSWSWGSRTIKAQIW